MSVKARTHTQIFGESALELADLKLYNRPILTPILALIPQQLVCGHGYNIIHNRRPIVREVDQLSVLNMFDI